MLRFGEKWASEDLETVNRSRTFVNWVVGHQCTSHIDAEPDSVTLLGREGHRSPLGRWEGLVSDQRGGLTPQSHPQPVQKFSS